MGTDQEAVSDLLRQYAALVNSGDFESWMALWAAHGCQMPPDAPARVGVGAIREGMKPPFDQLDFEFDLASIEEATVFGDLGLTRCNYSLKATPKEGGDTFDVMADGKALTLYERQADASWRIVYDSFNSNTG